MIAIRFEKLWHIKKEGLKKIDREGGVPSLSRAGIGRSQKRELIILLPDQRRKGL